MLIRQIFCNHDFEIIYIKFDKNNAIIRENLEIREYSLRCKKCGKVQNRRDGWWILYYNEQQFLNRKEWFFLKEDFFIKKGTMTYFITNINLTFETDKRISKLFKIEYEAYRTLLIKFKGNLYLDDVNFLKKNDAELALDFLINFIKNPI